MDMESALLTNKELVEEIGYNEAYLVLAVALFLEEPDLSGLAAAGLTEGGNDKKIDFIYHDVDTRRLVFAQGYMSSKKADAAPANKASDLNTACAWLFAGDVSLVPDKLRDIIMSCRNAIEQDEIDFIDLLYVHNLPESVNVSRELQTAEEYLRANVGSERILVKSHEFGGSRIQHLLAAQDSHIEVLEKIPFPAKLGIREAGDTWKAAVATISGTWVHELYAKYGDKLYSANYRGFLGVDGRKRVNFGIRESIEKTPVDFWAFNNGITILTLKLEEIKSNYIELSGISIINGAQTTGSIGSIDSSKAKLADVKVLCRVIECSEQATIDKIVRYNNTQNVITTWDQFSNDQEQKRIGDEFAELGFNYSRKRGFTGDGDQIGIEQVLQPLLAYHGRAQDAVRGKNQLFVQKQLYQNAFDGKKARHILFVHALSRAIDNKRLDLKAKSSAGTLISVEEKQIALLRNLNFKPFLMAVIANSLEVIVGVRCDPLTVGFKPSQAKNKSVAELSARWLPVIDSILPLLTAVVEPDTFFRKLSTEANFLANVKTQTDAMLTATSAADKHRVFAEMVAPT
ncbi:AIPR family protein [Hoeflea sp.]|uniref:AIPR family protein n=1 Tax=Hoeflea sp. TaxID=1940281 RepID=UPI003A9078F2